MRFSTLLNTIFLTFIFSNSYALEPIMTPSEDEGEWWEIQEASATIYSTYRYKTTRKLEKKDIPNLSYSTSFDFKSGVSLGIDYGYFAFDEGSDIRKKHDTEELTTSLSYMKFWMWPDDIVSSASISINAGYTYFTPKSVQDMYTGGLNASFKFWRLSPSIGVSYFLMPELEHNMQKQEEQEKITPTGGLSFTGPLGFYLSTSFSWEKDYKFEYDENYELNVSTSRYWRGFFMISNTQRFGKRRQVVIRASYYYTKYWKHDQERYLTDKSKSLKFYYYVTSERDLYVTGEIKHRSNDLAKDYYTNFSVNIILR